MDQSADAIARGFGRWADTGTPGGCGIAAGDFVRRLSFVVSTRSVAGYIMGRTLCRRSAWRQLTMRRLPTSARK
jgi:hypothetical protein